MSSDTAASRLSTAFSRALNWLVLLVMPAGIEYQRRAHRGSAFLEYVRLHLDSVVEMGELTSNAQVVRSGQLARELVADLDAGPIDDAQLSARVRALLDATGLVPAAYWAEIEQKLATLV